jgi:hypothetical protein
MMRLWKVLKSFDNGRCGKMLQTPQHFESRANLPKSIITTLREVINLLIKGVLVTFNKSVEGVVGDDRLLS